MLQNFKDGFKDWFEPNSEENKNYFKNQMYQLGIIGWILILVSPIFVWGVVLQLEEDLILLDF